MSPELVTLVAGLVEIGFRYGPFFFSVWFLYAIARWSYKNYSEVANRRERFRNETLDHWYFLLGAICFGCILVIVSVSWWIENQPRRHVFTGMVKGIRSDGIVLSQRLFLREEILHVPSLKAGIKTVRFVAVADRPFYDGEEFEMTYLSRIQLDRSKTAADVNFERPLIVRYDGRDHYEYKVVSEPEEGFWTLQPVGGERIAQQ